MTTTMIGVEQPRDEQEQAGSLVHYRVEDGVGFIELDKLYRQRSGGGGSRCVTRTG